MIIQRVETYLIFYDEWANQKKSISSKKRETQIDVYHRLKRLQDSTYRTQAHDRYISYFVLKGYRMPFTKLTVYT